MGLSRRNQMAAQYAYALAQGELVQFANPFCSGYAAPELLIYGKTIDGASVSGGSWNRTGRNLYDRAGSGFLNAYPNGSNISYYDRTRGIIYFPCLPNTTYAASKTGTQSNDRLSIFTCRELPRYNAAIYNLVSKSGSGYMTATTTTDALAQYICVWAYWASMVSDLDTLQVEFGQEPTAYQPYRGQSIDLTGVTLGGVAVPATYPHITYTETGGQAWVADSLDLASGELIRRVDGASILPAPVTQFVTLADTPKIIPGENNICVTGSGIIPEQRVKYLVHS